MIIFNPVIISVIVLCVLCLCKLNVLMSMLIACFAGGLAGGLPIMTQELADGSTKEGIINLLTGGFSGNAETALAYVLLGTFATAMASTGIANILTKLVAGMVKNKAMVLLWTLVVIACLSQNVVPVHIAFIPILVPPLLVVMNRLKIDRRAAACALAFGLKAPYITIPVGFGLIFHGIIADNLTLNGMAVDKMQVWKSNWMLGLAMLVGLLIAFFVSYRKPREYKDLGADTSEIDAISTKLEYRHWITILAIVVVVILQILFGSLPLAALGGLIVMIVFGGIKWKDIDEQFNGGIKLMGFIAFVMLVAGGYASVIKATGGVEELVSGAIALMGGNKIIAATMITLIGLLVTMGIGTSFGTVPVLAVLYVPLCSQMGFSIPATILLMSAAAALGDAGSPASDTTLGPTAGLNADGQHDHIWDTCVPTFLHYNIPLMVMAIIGSQFI